MPRNFLVGVLPRLCISLADILNAQIKSGNENCVSWEEAQDCLETVSSTVKEHENLVRCYRMMADFQPKEFGYIARQSLLRLESLGDPDSYALWTLIGIFEAAHQSFFVWEHPESGNAYQRRFLMDGYGFLERWAHYIFHCFCKRDSYQFNQKQYERLEEAVKAYLRLVRKHGNTPGPESLETMYKNLRDLLCLNDSVRNSVNSDFSAQKPRFASHLLDATLYATLNDKENSVQSLLKMARAVFN